jgi:hypothetical protein
MLYSFFWVIPRLLNFILPTFRNTLFYLHRRSKPADTTYENGTESSQVSIQTTGNHHHHTPPPKKKEYNRIDSVSMIILYVIFRHFIVKGVVDVHSEGSSSAPNTSTPKMYSDTQMRPLSQPCLPACTHVMTPRAQNCCVVYTYECRLTYLLHGAESFLKS